MGALSSGCSCRLGRGTYGDGIQGRTVAGLDKGVLARVCDRGLSLLVPKKRNVFNGSGANLTQPSLQLALLAEATARMARPGTSASS